MKRVGNAAVFLLIGALLFGAVQTVLLEKSSYPKYRAWKAAEDVDVLITAYLTTLSVSIFLLSNIIRAGNG